MQARLSHQGAPRGISLTTASGRARLAALELSAGRRTVITTGLAVLDNPDEQLAPLDAQLISFAKRQRGFKALLKLYGVGYLTAAAILTELGDCRRFSNSDDAVRYSGLDITVYETNGKIAGHLSARDPRCCAGCFTKRPSQPLARPPGPCLLPPDQGPHRSQPRLPGCRKKACRRAYHVLKELGDAALGPVSVGEGRRPDRLAA